jgi:hypothetical protein
MLLSISGVLLILGAPPLFLAAAGQLPEMLAYTMDETPAQLGKRLGQPRLVSDLGDRYRTLQYQIDSHDSHEFSHIVCVRRTDGRIASITRNYDDQRSVDGLFPPRSTSAIQWSQYRVRVRTMDDGKRLLLAMGTSKPGDKTSQLILIRRDSVADLMPWFAEKLEPATAR